MNFKDEIEARIDTRMDHWTKVFNVRESLKFAMGQYHRDVTYGGVPRVAKLAGTDHHEWIDILWPKCLNCGCGERFPETHNGSQQCRGCYTLVKV